MNFDKVVEELRHLVAFDTTSSKSNMAIIEYIQKFLDDHGVESELFPNESGDKANIWATIGAKGRDGGIVLSGHTDVVPVAGQPWETDPFTLTDGGDRFYGRGTCDMKTFPALCMAYLPKMLAKPLQRPIHFAFSFDEEVGCTGVPFLIDHVGKSLPMPKIVIVGEPSNMQVVSAHKGIAVYKVTVQGHEVHSSQTHRGVSAVMTAAKMINKLSDMAENLRQSPNPAHALFDPPYTSIHVGVVAGGTAPNIISRHAEFLVDIRACPGDDSDAIMAEFKQYCDAEILPEMQAVHPDTGFSIARQTAAPALAEAAGSEAESLVRMITGDNETRYVPYGTEAGLFQQADMSVVVCGPGSIDQAHQPNEFIEKQQIYAGMTFMEKLIDHLQK